MRTIPFLLAASAVAILSSCSTIKNHVTTGDIAAFKLRDLTRFGQPHLVKISPEDLRAMEQADLQLKRTASFGAGQNPAPPAHFVPPSLPDGKVTCDGAILPPKDGESSAHLEAPGFAARKAGEKPAPNRAPQDFSIE